MLNVKLLMEDLRRSLKKRITWMARRHHQVGSERNLRRAHRPDMQVMDSINAGQ